ncbi:hypothetical protein HN587_07050 [Candidatus Woesearchaeota archaeon]|nr:hypothetical protein [Candidatus Woesearchaeota archaeon]
MPTVSHIVKKIIESRSTLYEALANDIVNYPNLADYLTPEIERELGSSVKNMAIVMALRRYREKIKTLGSVKVPFKFDAEITLKTGLCDMTFVKSPSILSKLKEIYGFVNQDKGETLNIIQGNYEVTIVVSDKYREQILELLKGDKKINVEKKLVSLAMSFSKDFLYTPGIIAKVTRKLFWDGINCYENISTMTEVIFIVHERDAIKAFNSLKGLT